MPDSPDPVAGAPDWTTGRYRGRARLAAREESAEDAIVSVTTDGVTRLMPRWAFDRLMAREAARSPSETGLQSPAAVRRPSLLGRAWWAVLRIIRGRSTPVRNRDGQRP